MEPLKTKEQIENWLDNRKVQNYTIREDLSIDIDGDVNLWPIATTGSCLDYFKHKLEALPVKFNKVNGTFSCPSLGLTSLDGCPIEVSNNFDCANNRLTNLVGSPAYVGGDFDCSVNQLTSLSGAPKRVVDFLLFGNEELESLIGGPEIVRGTLDIRHTKIKSIEYGPLYVGEEAFFDKLIEFPDPKEYQSENIFDDVSLSSSQYNNKRQAMIATAEREVLKSFMAWQPDEQATQTTNLDTQQATETAKPRKVHKI